MRNLLQTILLFAAAYFSSASQNVNAQLNDGDWLYFADNLTFCIDQFSFSCWEADVYIEGSIEDDPCPTPRKLDFIVKDPGGFVWFEKLQTTQTVIDFPLPLGEWQLIIIGYDACNSPANVYDTMALEVIDCGPPYAFLDYPDPIKIPDPGAQVVFSAIGDAYDQSSGCLQGGFIDSLKIKFDDGTNEPINLSDSLILTVADTGYQLIELWEFSQGAWYNSGENYFHVYLPYDNTISGTVYYDQNKNCNFDEGEPGIENREVYALSIWNSTATDSAGQFEVEYPVPIGPSTSMFTGLVDPFSTGCLSDSLIQNEPLNQGGIEVDFGVQLLPDCSELRINITTPFLRRCFDNYYFVNYCNAGTDTAFDARIEIDFDPYLNILESTFPWTNINGTTYKFDLGDVAGGACGHFKVLVRPDCDSTELGQLHCTEAHIYPDDTCADTTGLWGGGNIEINAICTESNVTFIIKNTGTGPTTVPLDYFIVEDDIIIFYNTFGPLPPGDSLIETLPKNGAFYLVHSQQEPNHPFGGDVGAFLEGCANATDTISYGFFGQFPVYDPEPFFDLHCIENQGSFDPNDKSAMPLGFTENQYIEPGDRLEYMIRFQNTGTDTAFKVRIVDTLSEHLLIGTFKPVIASHPYSFSISPDGVAEFLFEPIALPDSNVNVLESQGFVTFEIQTRKDVPAGTVIWNDAAIYFDFNEPVITNLVDRQIEPDFPFQVYSSYPPPPEKPVGNEWTSIITPNPMDQTAQIKIGHPFEQLNTELFIYDGLGRLVRQIEIGDSGKTEIPANEFSSGIYYYQILKYGHIVHTKSFMVTR